MRERHASLAWRNVDVAADDIPGLVRFALAEKIDLTIVGPEGALVLGVTDAFGAAGLALLRAEPRGGATRRLQGHMKEFLRRHSIPTAAMPRSRSRASTRPGARAARAAGREGGRARGRQGW